MLNTTLVAGGAAVLFALLACAVVFWRTKCTTSVITTAVSSIVGGFFFFKIWIYLFTPAFVGTFWGYADMVLASIILAVLVAGANVIVAWFKSEKDGYRRRYHEGLSSAAAWTAITSGALVVVLFSVWFGTYAYHSWGDSNIKRWSALLNVRVAPDSETLPPSNTDRIQVVTRGIAQYRAAQQLTKDGGQELSSIWKVRKSDWAEVSVKGKTYWVAPLVPASDWMQFIKSVTDSPGFVSVDKEDVNGEVKVHLGHSIKIFPNGFWMRSLERHVYYDGNMDGILDDPTLEVDDNWKPYYTMTYTQPKFVIGGQVMKKMIVVDANTGEVKSYKPGQYPEWIERVMSDEITAAYAKYYGHYSHENVVWWNGLRNGGRYEQQPADMDFVFNQADQSVWSIPMTSTKSSDSASTGVLYVDTRKNSAVFYQGLKGIGVGDAVRDAFFNARDNKAEKYDVRQVQLYAINGEPTYIAIYVNDKGEAGESFAGIGIVHARKIQAANVIMDSTKNGALSKYVNWLASGGAADVSVSKTVEKTPLEGVIFRIGEDDGIYRFKLEGNPRTFTVLASSYKDLPLVRSGDKVKILFLDNGGDVVPVSEFRDVTIEDATGQ